MDHDARAGSAGLGLDGKRVLLTGAASGIGRATATLLAGLGAELVLVDVAPLAEVEAEVRRAGAKATTRVGNLADEPFLQALAAEEGIFAFANCAAVFSREGWREDLSAEARFDLLMRINVRAPLVLGNAFVDRMGERGGGFIVLVGSAAGRNGGGIAGGTPLDYAASKGAVHTLVRSLSRHGVGRNVLVNGVAPGPVDTPLARGLPFAPSALPLGRMGRVDEIAWPIAFLCSPAASYISGAVLDVNGGAFVG
ncbi:SDR family NAD(P)-dependent oxidoreductase [Vineibacter terrae]|uniref:SDR family NAD(P)-dependent oxidoreductase n=1 Tax=Vineibacter terrae TaxID=2586908 RepID=UPI0015B6E4DC|nr:SDR family oxidoreductase [Vineibacter terrae]